MNGSINPAETTTENDDSIVCAACGLPGRSLSSFRVQGADAAVEKGVNAR